MLGDTRGGFVAAYRVVAALSAFVSCASAAGQAGSAGELRALAEIYAQPTPSDEPFLSPDGSEVAFVMHGDDGASTLLIHDVASRERRVALQHSADPRLEWCQWKSATRLLCATTHERNRDWTELLVVELDTGASHEVGPFKTLRHVLPHDPAHVIVEDRGSGIGTLELESGKFRGTNGLRGLAITDGNGAMRITPGNQGWLVQPSTDKSFLGWVLLHRYEHSGTDWFEPAAFDERTNEAYYVDMRDGFATLFAKDVDGDRVERVVAGRAGAHATGVDMIGKDPRVGSALLMEGRISYVPVDARVAAVQAAVQRSLAAPLIAVTDEDWSQRYYLVFAGPALGVGTWYRFDSTEQRLDEIRATHPNVAAYRVAPRTKVDLGLIGGHAATAYLSLPAQAARPPPVVVMPGGFNQTADFHAPFLNASGYAVLEIPLPPLAKSSLAFDLARTRSELDAGLDWLVRAGNIDATRVCVLGWDHGAYVALAGAGANADRFRCAVGIDAVVDSPGFRVPSLVELAPSITMPVLLINPRFDRGAERLRKELAEQGTEVELVGYDDYVYGSSESIVDALMRAHDFLSAHLR
jgi:hypothetical protein